ncbi:hypothetical protein Hanom_Chr11g01060221 [Helianthus anomalus]
MGLFMSLKIASAQMSSQAINNPASTRPLQAPSPQTAFYVTPPPSNSPHSCHKPTARLHIQPTNLS